jgi:hypothetical protein
VVSYFPFLLSSSSACSLSQRSPVGPCLTHSPLVSWRHPKLCYTRPLVPASAQWRACIRPRLGGHPTSCLSPRRRPRACADPAPAMGYTSRPSSLPAAALHAPTRRPPPAVLLTPPRRLRPRNSPLPTASGSKLMPPGRRPRARASLSPAAQLGPLRPCSALHGPPPQWSERGK